MNRKKVSDPFCESLALCQRCTKGTRHFLPGDPDLCFRAGLDDFKRSAWNVLRSIQQPPPAFNHGVPKR